MTEIEDGDSRRRFLQQLGGLMALGSIAACSDDKHSAAESGGEAETAVPERFSPEPFSRPTMPGEDESGATVTHRSRLRPGAKLQEDDPLALAVGYHDDADAVDAARFPRWQEGTNCSTCRWFEGAVATPSGLCGLLSGAVVSASGWCNGYAPSTT